MNKSKFDDIAKTWETPPRQLLAEAVSTAIIKNIVFDEKTVVADFGAGTGLVSLAISQLVKSVTAIDESIGMLEVLKEKSDRMGIKNISAVVNDSENLNIKKLKFDVVVSSMTLHHMKSTEDAASLFYSILNDAGMIAIADIDKEDGNFHSDQTGIHHFGFERENLKNIFINAGFKNIRFDTVYFLEKTASDGVIKEYPVFLMIGDK